VYTDEFRSQKIKQAFGHYLEDSNFFNEAGMIFLGAGDKSLEQA